MGGANDIILLKEHAYWEYTEAPQLGTPCYKGQSVGSQWRQHVIKGKKKFHFHNLTNRPTEQVI